jgi:hypothetical protein
MQEPIQHLKLLKPLLLHDHRQVKLHIGLPTDVVGIPKQPDKSAIRHEPPQMIRAVEKLLHQGMWRVSRLGLRIHFAEHLIGRDDMHGGRLGLSLPSPMGNNIGRFTHLIRREIGIKPIP